MADPHTAEPSSFQSLSAFIQQHMKMSHLYQPVMLIELLRRGGEASTEDIAKALLAQDRSQIEYYQNITRNMVGTVLRKRGIVTKEAATYRLNGFEELNATEVEALVSYCEQRLEQYLQQRGKQIFAHRRKSAGYVSGTLRYEVLKRAGFHCELCGASADEKALEVDHILPRNHGGSDDLSNLQALCFSCNAMKRDRDDTDFRGVRASYSQRSDTCLFCTIPTTRIVAENELAYAIADGFPVTAGHTLVIPKRHVSEYFSLHQPELNACNALLKTMRARLLADDATITGFNIGMNNGADAGQTIFHCHIHLIPRRHGDVAEPRGGIRHLIPGKGAY